MESALSRQEDGTITLTITIPASEVEKTRNEAVAAMAKNVVLPGFRKGKAPKNLAEEQLDKGKVREEVTTQLLPKYYVDTVKEHTLAPIMNPKIHVVSMEEGKDWQFEAFTCESPNVDLNNYKANIQKVTAAAKIIIPGKEEERKGPNFEAIVKALLESVTVTIPHILIEQEVERLLSRLLDDIRKLGLNLDQYLSSTGKTAESLRKEYKSKASSDLTLEFALAKIAEEERITVDEKEIEEAIQKANEKEREHLQKNRYLLASILRQQKTLDFLKNL